MNLPEPPKTDRDRTACNAREACRIVVPSGSCMEEAQILALLEAQMKDDLQKAAAAESAAQAASGATGIGGCAGLIECCAGEITGVRKDQAATEPAAVGKVASQYGGNPE